MTDPKRSSSGVTLVALIILAGYLSGVAGWTHSHHGFVTAMTTVGGLITAVIIIALARIVLDKCRRA